MDFFKFDPYITSIKRGTMINGIRSSLWVERYRDPGEFQFIAPVSSGLKDFLPIGTIVTHINSKEVMIVENHEIDETTGDDTTISITGRTFETILENRTVGADQSFPLTSGADLVEYVLSADYTWNQAVRLIQDHAEATHVVNAADALSSIHAITDIVGTSVSVARTVQRGSVYERLIEILAIDDLGIKVERYGVWTPWPVADITTSLFIHAGTDRTASVIFSYTEGEIASANYLWSNKKLKNAALVSGRWTATLVVGAETGYDRRTMFVDGSDLDNNFTAAPTGTDLTNVLAAMTARGNQALAGQTNVSIANANVSDNANRYAYRTDFNVGDLITVEGNYGTSGVNRIIEYVEIQDDTGERGYPTLSGL